MDIEHLKSWIGRKETAFDVINKGLLDRFNKTLGRENLDTSAPPSGIHWCLSPPTVPMSEVGDDGHPLRGGFLPPVPLAYRMWAAGKIHFQKPFPIDQEINRHSEILDVMVKNGSEGPLVFVDIGHQFTHEADVLLSETQTIVYKNTRGGSAPQIPEEPKGRYEQVLTPDSVLLFRYSALTFNGHRIHYDYPYATQTEGYRDIVVHGPLIATFLMHFAADCDPKRLLSTFQFRGVSPAFSGDSLRLVASKTKNGLHLEARGEDRRLIMKATAGFIDHK